MLYDALEEGVEFEDRVVNFDVVATPSNFQQMLKGELTPSEAMTDGGAAYAACKADPDVGGPSGAFPWIETGDGDRIAQCLAVSGYVAEICGFAPSTPLLRARCRMVEQLVYEDVMMKLLYTLRGSAPVRSMMQKVTSPSQTLLCDQLQTLEAVLRGNGLGGRRGGVCGSDTCSADFWLFWLLEWLDRLCGAALSADGDFVREALLGQTPLLVEFHARMCRRRGVVRARRAPSWHPYMTGLRKLEPQRYPVFVAEIAQCLRAETSPAKL